MYKVYAPKVYAPDEVYAPDGSGTFEKFNSRLTHKLPLVKESASLLEGLAEEKEQTLRVEGDGNVTVIADRTILRHALVNLIDNAVKYSPLKGEIRVRVTNNGQDALIEVRTASIGLCS